MQMKKRFIKRIFFIILLFFLVLLNTNTYYCYAEEYDVSKDEIISSQKNSFRISDFINEAQKYTSNSFDNNINYNNLLNDAIKGKIDNNFLGRIFIKLLGKETIDSIRVIGCILVIIVIHSILNSINENFQNNSVSKITYYVQYILIVTIIMANFSSIIDIVRTSINNLVSFSNSLIPLLMALIISTGNIASTAMLEPILLFIITFIGNFINNIIIPITLITTSITIVSKISDRIQLQKLSKFFKSAIIWTLGVLLTFFVGLVSLEGTLSSSVDGITAKTTKAAVSGFIPVVGKILSDAVDTVLGCTNILKNAVGIVGVLTIVGICILPIIKLTILMISYYIVSAVCEPIADKKIVELLSQFGDTYKILLAILCSISVMLIIGTTLVIKISNISLTYR